MTEKVLHNPDMSLGDDRSQNLRCSLCGNDGANLHHYLEKTQKWRTLRAIHPLSPLLCEDCAIDITKHTQESCDVWEGARCVTSHESLRTNVNLY